MTRQICFNVGEHMKGQLLVKKKQNQNILVFNPPFTLLDHNREDVHK